MKMETKAMKWCIWVLICFVWIVAYATAEEIKVKCLAQLPEGTTVELVGLRSYGAGDPQRTRDKSGPWWGPDGTQLTTPPDERFDSCSWSDSYLFVITIEGKDDCICKAVGPWDSDLTVQPTRERDKGQGFVDKNLRRFTLRFGDQKSADIRLGLATSDWRVVICWQLSERSTPYNHFFVSSEQVIMRCPEQKGTDIISEVTQTITDQATRLVVFDREGNQYESYGDEGGKSGSLVRYIHYFRNLSKDAIDHLEFQAKPYEYWITFRNVSLQMGQKTQVEVDIKKPGSLLVGEAIPDLDSIKIDLPADQTKDKMILLCFFDMNQRPSRNCLWQLSKRAPELEAKDVVVVAVQASKVNEETLNEWMKKNNIQFPVGMIQSDVEKTKFAWGVRSLPWLILTDRNHVVCAEGFVLTELNARIKEENEEK